MLGVIRTRDILAHPVVTIRCFGWVVLLRALTASRGTTFLELVCAVPAHARPVAVPELLERAIALEERAGTIYEDLSGRFSDRPEVAAFFAGLAREEEGHAELLRLCRAAAERSGWQEASFTPWRASIPKLEEELEAAEIQVREAETLDEVFSLVLELEASEINDVFEAVVKATDSDFVRTLEAFQAACATHLEHLRRRIAELSPEAQR
ncbi:MAG: ferritin family protein [Deltaproteobacteria bacterium]|nr:ferritin family protein [Deltaproteobacteria bacterium]